MKGWSLKRIINNPIGYLEKETREKIKLWKMINKNSSDFIEADLSCSILEKYEKRLGEINKLKEENSQ